MINREAILHIPLSEYAFANSETSLTIRLRCAKNNVIKCTLCYADRVYPTDPLLFTPIAMEVIAQDLYFDYYEATFESPYTRVCYYFELESDNEQALYYSDLFENHLPAERSEFYQYPFIRREEISTVPEWLKQAVVYNIFPDSFATGKEQLCQKASVTNLEDGSVLKTRLGGTIEGIRQNLEYIQGLGFNCIYLNPIFTAGEYHKYDLLDYFHVSPNMGTDEEFKALVQQAHKMGIRVVIDGVFNHCSWHFFAFDDVVKKGEQSEYKDWFYELEFPVIRPQEDEKPSYSSFAYEPKMPKLNSSHPQVQSYFLQVCKHWLQVFDVDGWRLDVANEVDKDFWRAFQKAARSVKADSIMIGEIWESAQRWLQGDMFDSAMNYDFRRHCRDFFGNQTIDAIDFQSRITNMLLRYPTGIVQGQLNLLDSHDVNRFLYHCQEDIRRYRLALVFLFTAPGVPCIFYGDELGIAGGDEFSLRSAMPWEKPYHDLRALIQSLASLRKEDTWIYGNYRVLQANHEGLYIFERCYNFHRVIVALNARDNSEQVSNLPNTLPTMAHGYSNGTLQPYGFVILEEKAAIAHSIAE